MAIRVADHAPDFRGRQALGEEMSDFQLARLIGHGPIVLQFFPFAFSGGCTKQVCAMRDLAPRWRAAGAQVLGVSVDPVFALRAFGKAERLGYPLVSDFNREGMRAYGVEYADFLQHRHVAKRSVFVIDNAGVVRFAWVSDDAEVQPPHADVLAVIEKLT